MPMHNPHCWTHLAQDPLLLQPHIQPVELLGQEAVGCSQGLRSEGQGEQAQVNWSMGKETSGCGQRLHIRGAG